MLTNGRMVSHKGEVVKHGVIILEHENWNTKQIWNRGCLVMVYRRQPKKIHFKSPMVNDANQDLAGGWFLGDISFSEVATQTVGRVLQGSKPMGVITTGLKSEANARARETKGMGNLEVRVVPVKNREFPMYDLVFAQGGTLRELFDLDILRQDYVANQAAPTDVLVKEFSTYANRKLIDVAANWDVGDVPMWVTGLILGYPVENTISLYKTGPHVRSD